MQTRLNLRKKKSESKMQEKNLSPSRAVSVSSACVLSLAHVYLSRAREGVKGQRDKNVGLFCQKNIYFAEA